jgi:hypothetical protein
MGERDLGRAVLVAWAGGATEATGMWPNHVIISLKTRLREREREISFLSPAASTDSSD